MSTSIQIPLDAELAHIYNRATNEEQMKLQILVTLWLRAMDASNPTSLSHLMDKISDMALQNGLTPEILKSLLNDKS